MSQPLSNDTVLQVSDVESDIVDQFLGRYGITLEVVPDAAPITASFWGEPEAGIVGRQVFVRGDPPVHSMLHEACHIICMSAERRDSLYRDAGGNDLEESAVCYLQVVLADSMVGVGRARLMCLSCEFWGEYNTISIITGWFGKRILIKESTIIDK